MSEIVVIGSINADLITVTKKFPRVGETVIGEDFTILPGGKGANQAVCAAKLGANVQMIGCVGNDYNGRFLKDNFAEYGIDSSSIHVLDNVPSGVAQITIADNNNAIIVVSGANGKVTRDIVNRYKSRIKKADIVVMQLEIPIETVEYVIDFCHDNHVKVILNPAPAKKLNQNIIEKVTYLTPNKIELQDIYGRPKEEVLRKYPNKVIMTAGSDGVYYHDGNQLVNVPACKVDVIDTTGAGDSFNGALAFGLSKNMLLPQAIEFANQTASKTIQKIGAQTAMPTLEELK